MGEQDEKVDKPNPKQEPQATGVEEKSESETEEKVQKEEPAQTVVKLGERVFQEGETTTDEKKVKFLMESLKHSDDIVHSRYQFWMLSQSFLITAAASVASTRAISTTETVSVNSTSSSTTETELIVYRSLPYFIPIAGLVLSITTIVNTSQAMWARCALERVLRQILVIGYVETSFRLPEYQDLQYLSLGIEGCFPYSRKHDFVSQGGTNTIDDMMANVILSTMRRRPFANFILRLTMLLFLIWWVYILFHLARHED